MSDEKANRWQFSIARMLVSIALVAISIPFWLWDVPWVFSGHIIGGFCLGAVGVLLNGFRGFVVGAAIGVLLVPVFLSLTENIAIQ